MSNVLCARRLNEHTNSFYMLVLGRFVVSVRKWSHDLYDK